MVYEIINPSDAYTMKSDDPVAACCACLFLGEGRYALRDKEGESVCPLFILGGDPAAWFRDTFGITLDDAMASKRIAVADALDSVLIGGFAAREEVESAIELMQPEDAEKWMAKRHDDRRSSMNDIGKRAKVLAKFFREKERKEVQS